MWGTRFMLFRFAVAVVGATAGEAPPPVRWERCDPDKRPHEADSLVHRYQREVRFKRT